MIFRKCPKFYSNGRKSGLENRDKQEGIYAVKLLKYAEAVAKADGIKCTYISTN